MGYRLAVDLGTAFAAAAVVNGTGPTMVGLGNRTMQVPSVLYLAQDDSFVVGEAAERRGTTDPGRLVREFKRRFGDPVPLLVAGAAYSAESLMARLLRWVVATTAGQQGEPPTDLMLTHPANWGPYKRELLDQVVALADLPPARYCTEPEAAAVNYAARTKVEVGDRIAVYDLGGGTFDVCVLEKRDLGFAVLGVPDGVEHLGGADIDEAMTQLVLQALADRLGGADLDDPAMTIGLARLRRDCVDGKEALSTETDVAVPVALPGLNTTVRVTRSELEATMRPALLDTLAAFRRTLASARTLPRDLAAIVLVGGSSRIPLVGELLQTEFGAPLSIDTHPKHDIALGAALLSRERDALPSAPAAPSVPAAPSASAAPSAPTASAAGPTPGTDPFGDPDYLAAVAAGFSEQWAVAVPLLERVAERYPGQRRVIERLDRARRELRVLELTEQADRAEQERSWAGAAESLEQLLALRPSDSDLAARLDRARSEVQTDALRSELRSLYAAGQWESVLRAGDELRALAPDRVPEAMLTGARHELDRAALGERYRVALRALDAEDWPAAVVELEAVVAADASFEDAATLLTRAQDQLRLAEQPSVAEQPSLAEQPSGGQQVAAETVVVAATETGPTAVAPAGPGHLGPEQVGIAPAQASAGGWIGAGARPPEKHSATAWHRRRRVLVAGLALVVMMVGGVVTGVVLSSKNNSSGSGSSSAAAGPASASVELTGSPSVEGLLAHVPSDYRDSCHSVESDMRSAAVKLECPIEGSKVSMVTHFQYNSQDAYDRAVAATFTASQDSDCSQGPGQRRYRTSSGPTRSGLLACATSGSQIIFASSTDQLWVISVAQATYDSDFGYPQMKGSWEQYPFE